MTVVCYFILRKIHYSHLIAGCAVAIVCSQTDVSIMKFSGHFEIRTWNRSFKYLSRIKGYKALIMNDPV